MFSGLKNLFKRKDGKKDSASKDTAKERLHLVLMQDRANISADFLALMKQEIIEVIKKYIDVDEKDIDVRLTNKPNEDGTMGAPALYANIPIAGVKETFKAKETPDEKKEEKDNKENKEIKDTSKNNNEKVATDKKEENKSENKEETKSENQNIENKTEIKVEDKETEKSEKVESENKDNSNNTNSDSTTNNNSK